MQKQITLSIIAILIFSMSINLSTASTSIEWYSYGEGMDEAHTQDKTISIYFGSSWCSHCVRMKNDVFPDPRVVEASGGTVFIEVDTDEESSLANLYGIRYLPTMVFLTPAGNEQFRRTGYRDVSELLADIALSKELYHGKQIDWFSYEDGRIEANRGQVPMLLYFRDDNCQSCQQMEKEVFSSSQIVDMSENFVMIKIEAPLRPTLVQRYGVESFPEILLTDHQGTEQDRFSGFTEKEELYDAMNAIIDAEEVPEESTPGFTFPLLLLTSLMSLLLYGKVIYSNKRINNK